MRGVRCVVRAMPAVKRVPLESRPLEIALAAPLASGLPSCCGEAERACKGKRERVGSERLGTGM